MKTTRASPLKMDYAYLYDEADVWNAERRNELWHMK